MFDEIQKVGVLFAEEMAALFQNEVFWFFLFVFILLLVSEWKILKKKKADYGIFRAFEELTAYLAEALVDFIEALKCAVSFKDGIRMLLFGRFTESAQFVMLNYAIAFLCVASFVLTLGGLDNVVGTVTAIFMAFGLEAAFLLLSSRLASYIFPQYRGIKKHIYYLVDGKSINISEKLTEPCVKDKNNWNGLCFIWRIIKFALVFLSAVITGITIVYFSAMSIMELKFRQESTEDHIYSVMNFIVEDSREYSVELDNYCNELKESLGNLLLGISLAWDAYKSPISDYSIQEKISQIQDILPNDVIGENDIKVFFDFVDLVKENESVKGCLTGNHDGLSEKQMFVEYAALKNYLVNPVNEGSDETRDAQEKKIIEDIENWAKGQKMIASPKKDEEENLPDITEPIKILNDYIDFLSKMPYEIQHLVDGKEISFYKHFQQAINWQKILLQIIDETERSRDEMAALNGGNIVETGWHLVCIPSDINMMTRASVYLTWLLTIFITVLCLFRGRMIASQKNFRKKSIISASFLKITKEEETLDGLVNSIVLCIYLISLIILWFGTSISNGYKILWSMIIFVIVILCINILFFVGHKCKKEGNDGDKPEDGTDPEKSFLSDNLTKNGSDFLSSVEIKQLYRIVSADYKIDDYYNRKKFWIKEFCRFIYNSNYQIRSYWTGKGKYGVIIEKTLRNEAMVSVEHLENCNMKAETAFLCAYGLVYPLYDAASDYKLEGYVLGKELLTLLFDCIADQKFGGQSIERTFEEEMAIYEEPEED